MTRISSSLSILFSVHIKSTTSAIILARMHEDDVARRFGRFCECESMSKKVLDIRPDERTTSFRYHVLCAMEAEDTTSKRVDCQNVPHVVVTSDVIYFQATISRSSELLLQARHLILERSSGDRDVMMFDRNSDTSAGGESRDSFGIPFLAFGLVSRHFLYIP